jgi:hypothetical protein
MNGADLTSVVPIDKMKGDSDEETLGLKQMFEEARGFLSGFAWCQRIEDSYFGFGYAGIVAVFLFRISPAHTGIDDWLWVVVGDLPSAYLVTEGNLTPDLAVDGYIYEMSRWVQAAKGGRPVKDLIPVNVPPTQENAEALERRLSALKDIIKDAVESQESTRVSREVH